MSAEPVAAGSRERIIDAALELIARYGIAGMSLQLLADHVGLHKSTLFHHFADKRQIVDAATRRFMAEVIRRAEALEQNDPPDLETFVAIAGELDDWFSEHPPVALFVMRDILGPFEPGWGGEMSPETTRFFAIVASWLDRARRCGAVRALSVPQAIVNLLALVLLPPALVDHFGEAFAIGDPRGPDTRRRRRRELRETLRRALAP